MSKESYVRRKWMKMIQTDGWDSLVGLLLTLKAISEGARVDFLLKSGKAYNQWREKAMKQEAKVQQRSYSKRPPSIIKPTGIRK